MNTTLVILMFSIFFIIAFMDLPLAFVMGLAGTIPILLTKSASPMMTVSAILSGMDSFTLLACPFFILSGNLMVYGGLAKKLVAFANSLVGNIRGGLAMVCVIACVFFGALSGSGPATLAAIGGIMIPYMVEAGYPLAWATALAASSGLIGIFIPPSVAMINYGVLAGTSIADMLLSGVGPGLLTGIVFCVLAYFTCKKRGFGEANGRKVTLKGIWVAFKGSVWALLMPLIILGGIYGGFFTPTEAAAVACIYSFLVGVISGNLKPKDMPKVFKNSAVTASVIMFSMGTASAFGKAITLSRLPTALVSSVTAMNLNQYMFLGIVTIIILIMGTFMSPLTTVQIVTPILLPVALSLKINPVHFGAALVVNSTFGMITPPLGSQMFLGCSMTGLAFKDLLKEMWAFIIAAIIIILLVTYLPVISIGLVQWLRW